MNGFDFRLMKGLRAVVNLSWHHAHCDKVDEQL